MLHYLELAGPLERSGIATATNQQRTALERVGTDAGIDLELVTNPWQSDLRSVCRALGRGQLPVVDYDLAHCNAIGPGTVAIAHHARRTGRPLIVHAHVTSEDFRQSFRGSNALSGPLERYLRWIYNTADLVCCPSAYTRELLESYSIETPLVSITNGVDHDALAEFERFRDSTRNRFNLDGIVVSSMGNVFERKGVDTFCDLATRTPFEYAWFGPYDRFPVASSVVRKHTTAPPANVTFTGWIADKRAAFAAGDIFVFPTHEENQGIAVLEAMACGKPVVLRRLPVFEELYTDGVDCLMCDTTSEFEATIHRLAQNQGLRDRLGDAAVATAQKHDLETVGRQLLDVYDELLDADHTSC